MTASIPLPLRVPNPPHPYAPRGPEALLAEALLEEPVVALVGEEGSGRTALLCAAFKQALGKARDRTLYVPITDPIDPLASVLRALAVVVPEPPVAWSALGRSEGALMTEIIDRADTFGGWVALDDAHGLPEATRAMLLEAIVNYARSCRWVFVLREPVSSSTYCKHFMIVSPGEALRASWLPGRGDEIDGVEVAEVDTRLTALEHHLAGGDLEAAAALLEGALWPMLVAGYGGHLQRLLEDRREPALDVARLETLLFVLDAEPLARAQPPSGGGVKAQLLWAEVLMVHRRSNEALETLEALTGLPCTIDERWQRDLMAIHATVALGRFDDVFAAVEEALDADAAASPLTEARRVWLESIHFLALVWGDRGEEARALLLKLDLAGRLRGADMGDDAFYCACVNVVRGLHLLRSLKEASALLDRLPAHPTGRVPALYDHDSVVYLRALVAFERLELDVAGEAISRLERRATMEPGLRLHVQNVRLHLDKERLPFADARARIVALLEEALTQGDADHASSLRVSLGFLEATERGWLTAAPLEPSTGASPMVEAMVARYTRERLLRTAPATHVPTHAVHLELLAELVSGDVAGALEVARGWRASALSQGALREHAAALEWSCLAALAAGDGAQATHHLDALAERLSNQRLPNRARRALELRALLEAAEPQPMLRALVAGVDPMVVRLARGSLGDLEGLDRLELVLAEALAQMRPWRAKRLGEATPVRCCVDVREGACQLATASAAVTLKPRSKAWAIVTCLVQHGGAASKAELLAVAWGIDGHHPLRHENRLRLAVFKLRKQLQDTLGLEGVATTDDGYALEPGCCVIEAW